MGMVAERERERKLMGSDKREEVREERGCDKGVRGEALRLVEREEERVGVILWTGERERV